MNIRLLEISKLINEGVGFADIGTDHGYLPIYMAQNGYKGNIFASDINADPLNCARRNAIDASVEDRISFTLCDGLDDSIQNRVDTIVIAGMGGDTICGILDRAEWCMNSCYKLILQPMTKAEILRYWLSYNDFDIHEEILLDDGGSIYQIICAVYGQRHTLSDAELFTGRSDKARKQPLYGMLLSKQIQRFEKLICGLECSDREADIIRAAFNKKILSELYALKEQYSDRSFFYDNSK